MDPSKTFGADAVRLAAECNIPYLHWSELDCRRLGSSSRDEIWSLMKLLRSSTAERVRMGGLAMTYNLTGKANRLLHTIDAETRLATSSASPLMKESIMSSVIEGATTPVDVAKRMLLEDRLPTDYSERMIHNNRRAMMYVAEHCGDPLTPEWILELHRIVSEGLLDDPSLEGRFRTDDSIAVRDAYWDVTCHQPPCHEEIGDMVAGLCRFADRESLVHPMVRGTILHFAMAYIHPFVDGNGRVSRCLFYRQLARSGYNIDELSISYSIYNNRGGYDDAYILSETDGNDITYFIDYSLEMVAEALDLPVF
ncbi:MAG: Fic family protein [Thermoplasmata archaeon]|nr:Fic family protein [Thermoplasmata archaeon]